MTISSLDQLLAVALISAIFGVGVAAILSFRKRLWYLEHETNEHRRLIDEIEETLEPGQLEHTRFRQHPFLDMAQGRAPYLKASDGLIARVIRLER